MQRSLLVFVVAAFLASPCFAQDAVPFDAAAAKQLAGPPSEFEAMRTPAPEAGAIHSHSALLSVRLDPVAGSTLTRWQGELPVDRARVRALVFGRDGELGDWQLRPATVRGVAAASLVQAPVATVFGMGNAGVPAMAYEFDGYTGDRLPLVLESAAGASTGIVLLEGDEGTQLVSWPLATSQRVGDRFAIAAVLDGTPADARRAVVGSQAGRIDSAVLRVTDPAGATREWPMHEDRALGDGFYRADFPLEASGAYVAQVEVRGSDAHGRAFVRTAEHLVTAVERSLDVAAARVTAERSDASRVLLQVPVRVRTGGPDHYRAFGEVWGSDATGQAIPVAWIGGMVAPANGTIGLGLDERWVDLAGAQAPFELRNLRIEEPEHFVAVATADRLALELPSRNRLFDVSSIRIDEGMLMGPRPDTRAPMGTGQRLVLVHGYCSGGVWPASQFANSATFLDVNQNRSNDQFALLLGSFGSTWNSFGTVAHSQGGMAALHLYTYYWSGLDNATGSRLLQSVGTPYQGTNLAGILAVLGNWFGVGCGSQTDLTYSGASAWLAGIPTWARAKVNYYSTAFKTTHWWVNDYCQFATDLVLDDPEDGTTEKASAQLSGAINRGHVSGQCHTTGMRDPAQYLDSSRNATMSANAAR